MIKQHLDLTETDSGGGEESVASTLSVSTLVSSVPVVASSSCAPTAAPPQSQKQIQIKSKNLSHSDLIADINEEEGVIPMSSSGLHHTGIPKELHSTRLDKRMLKGASLYFCPHLDCVQPYVLVTCDMFIWAFVYCAHTVPAKGFTTAPGRRITWVKPIPMLPIFLMS